MTPIFHPHWPPFPINKTTVSQANDAQTNAGFGLGYVLSGSVSFFSTTAITYLQTESRVDFRSPLASSSPSPKRRFGR